jgi:hypothetical protein
LNRARMPLLKPTRPTSSLSGRPPGAWHYLRLKRACRCGPSVADQTIADDADLEEVIVIDRRELVGRPCSPCSC